LIGDRAGLGFGFGWSGGGSGSFSGSVWARAPHKFATDLGPGAVVVSEQLGPACLGDPCRERAPGAPAPGCAEPKGGALAHRLREEGHESPRQAGPHTSPTQAHRVPNRGGAAPAGSAHPHHGRGAYGSRRERPPRARCSIPRRARHGRRSRTRAAPTVSRWPKAANAARPWR